MESHLERKRFLIEIFFKQWRNRERMAPFESYNQKSVWQAIDDFEDGYAKANLIKSLAHLMSGDIARQAYERASVMPELYRTRALAGIYPRMDEKSKETIFSYLCGEFSNGSPEATYQLKQLFPYLNVKFQDDVISAHLNRPNLPEQYLAYLVIRNSTHLQERNAKRIIAEIRNFQSDYLRYRCLLKLNAYLPPGEIDALYLHFVTSLPAQPPSSGLIHNLYHFSAVLKELDTDSLVGMALEKIAAFDDSCNEIYDQNKYKELSFITPHLNDIFKDKAFAIAHTVRGGYKKNMLSRLSRHFSRRVNFCWLRHAPIFY